jgi:hypothetical protein
VTIETGSAHRAITAKARRMNFPLAGGSSPLIWIDSYRQARAGALVKAL